MAGVGQAEMYLPAVSRVEALAKVYPLRREDDSPNLVIRIPTRWVFGERKVASAAIVAADLIDSGEPRSMSAGSNLMRQLVAETGAEA